MSDSTVSMGVCAYVSSLYIACISTQSADRSWRTVRHELSRPSEFHIMMICHAILEISITYQYTDRFPDESFP